MSRIEAFLLIAAAVSIYIGNPLSRTYWLYMITAYLMGVWAYMREAKTAPASSKELLKFLFPHEVWLHRSALNDCLVLILNVAVSAVVVTVVHPDTIMAFAAKLASYLPARHGPPAGAGIVLFYTVCSLLITELGYYLSHRITHKVPLLWEFHKIHHSAKVMTPLTVSRMHLIDVWQNKILSLVGLIIVSVLFSHLYPGIRVIQMLEVNVFVFIFNIFGANLRHSHIWISFGPKIERFILSPAQHQIHHSENPKHFEKNFGSQLSIWDWVFGSLYVTDEREHLTFGLGDEKEEQPYQSIWGLYAHPFKAAYKIIRGKKNAV